MSATLLEKGNTKMSKDDDKEVKPKIPADILAEFLARNISDADKKAGYTVRSHFLWKNGDVERYRINIWMVKHVEGQYCDRNYIGYSWFTHFHNNTKTLVDKTIIEVKEDGKKYHY